jgi:hypothetical protein
MTAQTAESSVPFDGISPPRVSYAESAIRVAGQRALRAAFIGFFVDMFDVYLPIVALGPAISYFQPATLSPALRSTLFYIVFALSLGGLLLLVGALSGPETKHVDMK